MDEEPEDEIHNRRAFTFEELATWNNEELVSRYQEQKDESAFSVLFRRWNPLLNSKCRRKGIKPQDAEEVAMDTFRKTVKKYVPSRGPFMNFLFFNLDKEQKHLFAKPAGGLTGYGRTEKAKELIRDVRMGSLEDILQTIYAGGGGGGGGQDPDVSEMVCNAMIPQEWDKRMTKKIPGNRTVKERRLFLWQQCVMKFLGLPFLKDKEVAEKFGVAQDTISKDRKLLKTLINKIKSEIQ